MHYCEFCEDEIPIDKYKQHLLECFDKMNSDGFFEDCGGDYLLDRFIEEIDEYYGAEMALKVYTYSSFYTPYTPIWIRSLSIPVLKILKSKSESYNQVFSILSHLIDHHAYMFKPGGYDPFFEFLEQITQEEGIWDLIKTTLNGLPKERKTEFSRKISRLIHKDDPFYEVLPRKEKLIFQESFFKKLLEYLNGPYIPKKFRYF